MEFGTGVLLHWLASIVPQGDTPRVINSLQFAQDVPDFSTEHPWKPLGSGKTEAVDHPGHTFLTSLWFPLKPEGDFLGD